jgi:hypothetical protein
MSFNCLQRLLHSIKGCSLDPGIRLISVFQEQGRRFTGGAEPIAKARV